MRHVTIGLAMLMAAMPWSAAARPAAPRRIVGARITGRLEPKGPQSVVEYATLQFGDGADDAFTVDFVARYDWTRRGDSGPRAVVPPKVVDVVITQHPPDEASPRASLQVDGRAVPLVARPATARSVVASMPFDAFVALAHAGAIVERAFDTDLVFGDGQLRMLRTVADRWSGR
jgi:hypothetical protein